MAKMFYTLDETKVALGRNEEDIKQLTREGRLREFRDGPRLMFKADQVEQLKGELGSSGGLDQVDLAPSESGAPIGLVDSRGASGSAIGISLSDNEGTGMSGSGLQMQMKDDTALAQDLGLSGSIGGMPSPSRVGGTMSGTGFAVPAGSGLSGTAAGRGGSGISVFTADDSIEHADPGAQTAITPTDQVNLEGVGSGSGLLDLTRESDDTSLGAELLDEIAPATAKGGKRRGPVSDSAMAEGLAEPRRGVTAPPVFVEAYDPSNVAFGMMAFGAALFCMVGALVVACAVVGVRPGLINTIAGEPGNYRPLWMLAVAGIGLAGLFGVFGLLAGKRR